MQILLITGLRQPERDRRNMLAYNLHVVIFVSDDDNAKLNPVTMKFWGGLETPHPLLDCGLCVR